MSQKLATKFANDVNKSLLLSESESDHEYTDIFEDNGTGNILASVSFEDGDSKSASDDEIVGYTGDIETYIGSNNEESDSDAHSLPDEQLIDFTSEGTLNDKIYETVIGSDEYVQKSLNSESKEVKLSETAFKLLDIKSEKNLRPGKPVLVKSIELISDSVEQSQHDHELAAKLEDVAEKKSFESFDPLSVKNLNENSPSSNSLNISDKQGSVTRSSRKRTRHRIYLDDPDIHQLIIEQVNLLCRKLAGLETKQALKSSSFYSQLNQTNSPDLLFRNKTKNNIPLNPVSANISTPKFQNAQQNLSVQFKGQKNRRGKNLISRIRNQNAGSEDDDEYTERMAKALHDRNSSYEICPDCGEYHSEDEDGDDDDVCPDCGVRHNPYQHSPIKNGVQHPRDEMEDNLPSIEGPLSIEELSSGYRYKLKYLGSCQVITKHPVTKETRLQQAQDAYKRIKAQDDDDEDASTNIDMCISLERIKIINKDTKFEDVMMDHALRTICFICDMGKILVLMARRLTSENSTDISFEDGQPLNLGNIVGDREKKSSKNICHVFKGVEDTSTIAQAIGQAFNIAYRQFLKSSGIAHELVEEAEYSHVLESQIIVGQDLENLTNESAVREVVVVKKVGDPLGIMLLESGWGSMLPTVFVAHIANYSATAQCQKISVGDHVLACDGTSLVGLALSECTTILKNCRNSNKVTFRVVTCPTVVDVVLLRPDVKYQLGFSVQDGTICSMLRGGIAERAGVRVGHRIIEINGDSVVAKSHQYIVDILAYTIGSISMKTMPIALYRLMVGEELPQHV